LFVSYSLTLATHININTMQGTFISCLSSSCPEIVEKVIKTEHNSVITFLGIKKCLVLKNYYSSLVLLALIGGGIYLWLKKPVYLKKFAWWS
jgi:hypothetical protein